MDKIIWNFLILVAIGMIVLAAYLMITEILEAKRECVNRGGEYKLDFPKGHLCSSKRLIEYVSCRGLICNRTWIYEDEINDSLLLLP